ncbi:MAG: DUF2182 domain-containing protein [Rhodospirillales bacterium]|nr:MAG: DUF2182 domain-containing protein [Rhodospirillales bacterium]
MRAATLFRRDDLVFVGLFASMVVLAWLALSLWSGSPYGRYLDHGSWLELGRLAAICEATPGGDVIVPMALHAGAWLLMCAAMMLPTALPLLMIWRRLISGRPDRRLLMGLVIAGYLAVWGGFGLAAHLADAGLHRLVAVNAWLAHNGWVFGVVTLGVAGLFQFSRLKDLCLDGCRSPLGFAMQAWRGGASRRRAWWLGVRHGAYCLGCCWALMLLMFVVGMGSIGWMLLLAAVMAAEKNLPWGHRLTKPVGAALLVAAAFVAGAGV